MSPASGHRGQDDPPSRVSVFPLLQALKSVWSTDSPMQVLALLLFFNLIYLFGDRAEGKEKDRERYIHVWLPLVHP